MIPEPYDFVLGDKAILGLDITCSDGQMAKIGLNGPNTKMVKVKKYYWDLTIKTNNFALEVKVTLDLEITCLEG